MCSSSVVVNLSPEQQTNGSKCPAVGPQYTQASTPGLGGSLWQRRPCRSVIGQSHLIGCETCRETRLLYGAPAITDWLVLLKRLVSHLVIWEVTLTIRHSECPSTFCHVPDFRKLLHELGQVGVPTSHPQWMRCQSAKERGPHTGPIDTQAPENCWPFINSVSSRTMSRYESKIIQATECSKLGPNIMLNYARWVETGDMEFFFPHLDALPVERTLAVTWPELWFLAGPKMLCMRCLQSF